MARRLALVLLLVGGTATVWVGAGAGDPGGPVSNTQRPGTVEEEIASLRNQIQETQEAIDYWEDALEDPSLIFIETSKYGLFVVSREKFVAGLILAPALGKLSADSEGLSGRMARALADSQSNRNKVPNALLVLKQRYRSLVDRRDELERLQRTGRTSERYGAASGEVDGWSDPGPPFELGRVWRVRETAGALSATGTWTRRGDSAVFDGEWTVTTSGERKSSTVTFLRVYRSEDGSRWVELERSGHGKYAGRLTNGDRSIVSGTADHFQSGWYWMADIEGR